MLNLQDFRILSIQIITNMKKLIVAILFLAFVAGETSCVVRVKERRRRPAPPAHGIVVY